MTFKQYFDSIFGEKPEKPKSHSHFILCRLDTKLAHLADLLKEAQAACVDSVELDTIEIRGEYVKFMFVDHEGLPA